MADGAAINVIDQCSEGPYTCAEKKEEYIQQFVQAGKKGKGPDAVAQSVAFALPNLMRVRTWIDSRPGV